MSQLGFEERAEEASMMPYRSVSKAAVTSLVLALLGIASIFASQLLILPAVGTILGLIGLSNIRRYPMELTGKPLAVIGSLLGLTVLVSGSVLHLVVYLTEVPDGYTRIHFYELQPDKKKTDMPIPEEALELDGKRVFVKGYVYPDGRSDGIKRFVLIPDMDTCCFGGQPELTDMIEVTLRDPQRIKYSIMRRKLGGVFKVSAQKKQIDGLDGVYYELDADFLK